MQSYQKNTGLNLNQNTNKQLEKTWQQKINKDHIMSGRKARINGQGNFESISSECRRSHRLLKTSTQIKENGTQEESPTALTILP